MFKPKIIGLIPARLNSTRFPGKPLALILGKPMIQWVYERARQVDKIDEIYVVTEDKFLAEKCSELDIPVWLGSKPASTGAEALSFASQEIEGDFFLNIQGDEPLIDPRAIEQIINALLCDDKVYYVGLRSKIKTEDEFRDRNVVKVVTDLNGYALYFSRMPIPYTYSTGNAYRVLGLYGYRVDFLRNFFHYSKSELEKAECGVEMLRMMEHGYRIKLIETEYNTIGVDLPEHIQIIEKIMT
jgi:3-deoxy-manno-octulosonate cytidylyltransferase (CMP-KDO synthetase)